MARLSDREQTVIPGETFLGLIKKYPDLPGGRESRHSMERYVPAMPRDGVFRDAIPSRDVAIRQPSPKIVLNFMALGVPAHDAVPRHAINLPAGLNGRTLFARPRTKRRAIRDMSHLPASSSNGWPR
jgi:hypothetical protein